MARMLLGDEIDLHSGGEDNIFPHHECEIAQSCCATGRPTFARVWFHTRHLQVEGEKMSKSKGNFFTARDLFARGVTPAALRLELIRTHYRTNSNFTIQGLQDCQRMIDRWARAREQLGAVAAGGGRPDGDEARAAGPVERGLSAFTEALCDDLNVARAVASLNEAIGVGAGAACPRRELSSLLAMDSVLGVLGRNAPVSGGLADASFESKVEALISRRAAARAAKDWAESDRIRDELSALGVTVKDGPTGASWTRSGLR
jgi:cysteinyl-tRNA synthetase